VRRGETTRRSRSGQYFSGRHRPGSVSRSSPATDRATSFSASSSGPLHRYLRPRRGAARLLSAARDRVLTRSLSPVPAPAPAPAPETSQAAPPHRVRVGYLPGRRGARWHALLNHFHLCRALCWLYSARRGASRSLRSRR